MKPSKLRQILDIFESSRGPLALPKIANDLEVSQEQLESMIRHWMRKGKVRETGPTPGCSKCGQKGTCPFVMEMPRSYELVTNISTASDN